VNEVAQIFVRVLDEAVDVWRPVQARHRFGNIYRIIDQPYDRDDETWEFGPGEEVICALIDSSGGQILAATGLYDA
jgi:hypothetical protein